ncbi:AAA family ATPase [Thermococcus sp. JCM 11816]|uniref:AAA family ATPase n=1 Tax=Thermococcus sp. (strain JCM 11816 / KS-1) TaxID=1295125 RepID=UPI003466C2EE
MVAKSILLSYVSDKGRLPNKTISSVNVLIVGDKGTNKTTFSRRLAELTDAVYVSATNMTRGGGLVGIVEQKENWGGWVYRPGALLSAKDTLLIIDEFDKIDDDDAFSSLLNVMSIGRFDYHKASINIDMELFTSIVALMNPTNGVLSDFVDVFKQIKVKRQEVLDRFALIWFVRSATKRELERITDKLVDVITLGQNTVYTDEELVRAYLFTARSIRPRWTKEANEELKKSSSEVIELLSNASESVSFSYGTRVITHLRNIATAYAKLLLDDQVKAKHVKYALNIFLDAVKSWGVDLPEFGREIVLDMDKESRDALVYAKNIVKTLLEKNIDVIPKEKFKELARKYAKTEEDIKRIVAVAKKFKLVEELNDGSLLIKGS